MIIYLVKLKKKAEMKGIEMKLAKAQQELITNLFLSGESLRKIAKKYNVGHLQVRNICISNLGEARYAMVMKKSSLERQDRNARIVADYNAGSSIQEITNKFDLSRHHIYEIVKKAKDGTEKLNGFSVPKKERKLDYPFTYHTIDAHFMEIAEMISK